MTAKRKVLITGANGRLGASLRHALADAYDLLLSDIRPPDDLQGQRFEIADITDPDAMRRVCQGIDTVVHLAATATSSAPWDVVHDLNIVGTYNVFQAAAEAGVRRVIFPSSHHTVLGIDGNDLAPTLQPRPISFYGASKAFGEALAHVYTTQHDLSIICLRIGWAQPEDSPRFTEDGARLNLVLTHRDFNQLVRLSIEAPDNLRFTVLNALSGNRESRLDLSETRRLLGYQPQDDGFILGGK